MGWVVRFNAGVPVSCTRLVWNVTLVMVTVTRAWAETWLMWWECLAWYAQSLVWRFCQIIWADCELCDGFCHVCCSSPIPHQFVDRMSTAGDPQISAVAVPQDALTWLENKRFPLGGMVCRAVNRKIDRFVSYHFLYGFKTGYVALK